MSATDYRSQDGKHTFRFRFVQNGPHIEIYCVMHPPLNGQDPSPMRTHLFESGKVCIVGGQEPLDMGRAQNLAAQWAEYFLRYRTSGTVEA